MKKTTEEYAPLLTHAELSAIPTAPTATMIAADRTLMPGYQSQPASMLEAVLKASMDPAADAAKVREFLDIALKLEDRDRETAFYRDMQLCQKEIEPVLRDRANDHTKSRYATLEAIDRAIRPVYTKHGFSLTSGTCDAPAGSVCVVTDCMHREGFKRSYRLTLPVDDVGAKGNSNKTPIQAGTSAVTYVRRTLETMIFNVILTNEDADGNAQSNALISDVHLKSLGPVLGVLTDDELANFLDFMGVAEVSALLDRDYGRAVAQLRPIWERKRSTKP